MSASPALSSIAIDLRAERLVAYGRDIILAEAAALQVMGHELGDAFARAIAILQSVKGRICLCGLGKSGQIARKIASTLAATGSPSLFLHAGEAVHGDLGMLASDDALLILSNSGDTRELAAITQHAARHQMPMVAITSSAQSRLAAISDVALILPDRAEVCPYGSSPTTSTTMMLAMGDALAITLMKLKGIDAAVLQGFHPGGRLGLDLVAIDSIMHRGKALPLVAPDEAMTSVLETISAKGFGIAAVVDAKGLLEGIITDGDVRRHVDIMRHARACDVMTRAPKVLTRDMLARDALTHLSSARITSLLVTDEQEQGRLVGLVHIHDLLRLGVG